MESTPSDLMHYHSIHLLWCGGDGGKQAVGEVKRLVTQSADPQTDICALLCDGDWRKHLIAAVALVVSEHGKSTALISELWTAFDTGSWVSPQLAVCLDLLDRDFESRARRHIEDGCPVVGRPWEAIESTPAQLGGEEPSTGTIQTGLSRLARWLRPRSRKLEPLGEAMARRHSQRGPAGVRERSAKALAALLYLSSLRAECQPWVSQCRADASIQRLLAIDRDRGDEIAMHWKAQFAKVISELDSSS